jgi:hypothetical protein
MDKDNDSDKNSQNSNEDNRKVKADKDISLMINVTKKKMEIQKGPRKLEDVAIILLDQNRKRLKEIAE